MLGTMITYESYASG